MKQLDVFCFGENHSVRLVVSDARGKGLPTGHGAGTVRPPPVKALTALSGNEGGKVLGSGSFPETEGAPQSLDRAPTKGGDSAETLSLGVSSPGSVPAAVSPPGCSARGSKPRPRPPLRPTVSTFHRPPPPGCLTGTRNWHLLPSPSVPTSCSQVTPEPSKAPAPPSSRPSLIVAAGRGLGSSVVLPSCRLFCHRTASLTLPENWAPSPRGTPLRAAPG